MATKKVLVKTVGHKLQRGTLYDTKKRYSVDPLHALLEPTFQQNPELK